MATGGSNAAGLGGLGKLTEVRQRLVFVLMALIVYRIGTHITIPGIDPEALAVMVEQQRGTILEMFNMFAGGALERLSIFALGIMPYISSAIIMQLLTAVIPTLSGSRRKVRRGAGRSPSTPVTGRSGWRSSRGSVSVSRCRARVWRQRPGRPLCLSAR